MIVGEKLFIRYASESVEKDPLSMLSVEKEVYLP